MVRRVLVVFAVIAIAFALVPKNRRALISDEDGLLGSKRDASSPETNTTPGKTICAPQTPCAWVLYKPSNKNNLMSYTNSYCVCGPGTSCQYDEIDNTQNMETHRCLNDTLFEFETTTES